MPARRSVVAEAALVVLGYFAVAVWATWPLAEHPLGGFYGFGNDNLGGIWVYDRLHQAYFGNGSTSVSPDLQAPFGFHLPDQVLQPMDRLYSVAFGGLGDGLGAYNAQIFISFVLAGCTMYLLARYLTGSRAAAAVAGFVYTFSPFHLAIAMQYNSLAAIEWIPLYLLALIVLLRRGRFRDAALAGGAFALVTITSYYYGWFVAWGTIAVLLWFAIRWLVASRRAGELSGARVRAALRLVLTRGAVGVAVALAIVIPLALPSLRSTQDENVAAQTSHPVSEAVRYSARPWMLLLPPHDNPLVGGGVDRTIMEHLDSSPVYEQSIYLGYGALLLALIALWRRRSTRLGALTSEGAFARSLLVAAAVGGLAIMIGPYLPLSPSYWRDWATYGDTPRLPWIGTLMFDLAPQFRFFVRAFVIVSAALAGLAAIGFARVERLAGPQPWRRAALAGGAIFLIGLEFTNSPPHVFTDTDPAPAWVQAVKRLPGDGALVDYPLAPLSSPRSLYYIFWQTRHGHPTLNPSDSTRAQALAATVASPDSPGTGRVLHQEGFRYAVIHTHLPPQTTPPYQPALPDDSEPADAGAGNPWFQRVATTPDAVIYRVLAAPRGASTAVARPGAGFGALEPEAGGTAQWLDGDQGTIAIYGATGGVPLALELDMASFGGPRTVRVLLDGRPVATLRVPPSYTGSRVALGRLAPGDHAVTLIATPGAQPIGNGDPRSVSIRLRSARVVRSS